MYGSLVNNEMIPAPNPMVIGENRVWNPTGEQYTTAGYKEVIFTDIPETQPGYHAEESWTETENQITEVWTVVEDPPDADIDPYEAYEIIFGGE